MVRVLFVCMGNICRSPVAQGVFESVARREGLAGDIEVDSAGTHGYYHAGEPPDPRAQESGLARGIDISDQRARRLEPEDCRRFDFTLTMAEENYRVVAGLCRGGRRYAPSSTTRRARDRGPRPLPRRPPRLPARAGSHSAGVGGAPARDPQTVLTIIRWDHR